MRALEFPDLLFTPEESPTLDRDGFLRPDLLQPVPTSSLEATPLALSAHAMEGLFGGKVMLELWVKVKSGWADNDAALRQLGYK